GGSDNHDAEKTPAAANEGVGRPTTVVHAAELSQAAVLDAIRQGHVFIDVWGTKDRLLEVEAKAGGASAQMGDALPAAAGTPVEAAVRGRGGRAGAVWGLAGDAPPPRLDHPALDGPEARETFRLVADGRPHWLRVDVRDAKGQLILIGNPIYLRPGR